MGDLTSSTTWIELSGLIHASTFIERVEEEYVIPIKDSVIVDYGKYTRKKSGQEGDARGIQIVVSTPKPHERGQPFPEDDAHGKDTEGRNQIEQI